MRELIETAEAKDDSSLIKDAVSSFSCTRNQDVENFLKENSVRFEKSDITRTYLIIDQDQYFT